MAEIELGKLAASRGQSADVKQFGQQMVTDHTKAGDELKQALSGSRYEVATQLDDKHNDLANKLRGMQGIAFDREYMKAMVDGHQDVQNMLDGRANETANNDATENAVNAWAKKTLPAVQHHLDMAKQIRDRIDAAYRNTTN
jgi:putative membrane protein